MNDRFLTWAKKVLGRTGKEKNEPLIDWIQKSWMEKIEKSS